MGRVRAPWSTSEMAMFRQLGKRAPNRMAYDKILELRSGSCSPLPENYRRAPHSRLLPSNNRNKLTTSPLLVNGSTVMMCDYLSSRK